MIIELKHVKKIYEKSEIEVVKDFNLTIEDKEFVVFVGPSGCGKSTTLRMIAGLEKITGGEILFDGKVINEVSPKDRNVAMVFQNYALYPNMTVYKNMEFPLKMNKVPEEQRRTKIKAVAEMLGLTEYLDRKPKNLSGGQRQRVAVGREIVRDVDIFLMDEPLSNLDAKLRGQMRTEISKLHRDLQKTFIYVTHDQIEAMGMATKIVVMKDGEIQQVGTPKEVFDNPSNTFVAGFIGTPSMNFINGTVLPNECIKCGNQEIAIANKDFITLKEKDYLNKQVILGIRPDDIILSKTKTSDDAFEISVVNAELLGSEYNVLFEIDKVQLTARIKATELIYPNEKLFVTFDTSKIKVFDILSTLRITD